MKTRIAFLLLFCAGGFAANAEEASLAETNTCYLSASVDTGLLACIGENGEIQSMQTVEITSEDQATQKPIFGNWELALHGASDPTQAYGEYSMTTNNDGLVVHMLVAIAPLEEGVIHQVRAGGRGVHRGGGAVVRGGGVYRGGAVVRRGVAVGVGAAAVGAYGAATCGYAPYPPCGGGYYGGGGAVVRRGGAVVVRGGGYRGGGAHVGHHRGGGGRGRR